MTSSDHNRGALCFINERSILGHSQNPTKNYPAKKATFNSYDTIQPEAAVSEDITSLGNYAS